jgi:hypothetical protein
MKFITSLSSLRRTQGSCMLALPAIALACGACVEHVETGAPSRTAAETVRATAWATGTDRALEDELVGVSTRPPVRRAPPEFDDADADAVRLFHDVLAPYGRWTDDPRLGLVWIPSREAIGASFVPYGTHGRWTHRELVTADAGRGVPFHEYVWVSDLPWGWVTFHYGRWALAGDRGWAWVAGRRYAGAWVDWRVPHASDDAIIGWGPTPPAHVWRITRGVARTRARTSGPRPFDPREARLVPTPYAAFATPYTYARARDLFASDLGAKLFPAASALAVAHTTEPAAAPSPERLGFRVDEVPAPPAMDRGLQQAWMLATPAMANAIGAGPELGPPPRLRTWVAGGTDSRSE